MKNILLGWLLMPIKVYIYIHTCKGNGASKLMQWAKRILHTYMYLIMSIIRCQVTNEWLQTLEAGSGQSRGSSSNVGKMDRTLSRGQLEQICSLQVRVLVLRGNQEEAREKRTYPAKTATFSWRTFCIGFQGYINQFESGVAVAKAGWMKERCLVHIQNLWFSELTSEKVVGPLHMAPPLPMITLLWFNIMITFKVFAKNSSCFNLQFKFSRFTQNRPA